MLCSGSKERFKENEEKHISMAVAGCIFLASKDQKQKLVAFSCEVNIE